MSKFVGVLSMEKILMLVRAEISGILSHSTRLSFVVTHHSGKLLPIGHIQSNVMES